MRAKERRYAEAALPVRACGGQPHCRRGGRCYRRQQGKSQGVLLPDAIIAATTRVHDARLYSTNVKHYPMDDLDVEGPY